MMWGYSMGWFGWVFMVSWWVLVLAGIVWLVRNVGERREAEPGARARRLLDERFAAGELSVDEYQERRRVLR